MLSMLCRVTPVPSVSGSTTTGSLETRTGTWREYPGVFTLATLLVVASSAPCSAVSPLSAVHRLAVRLDIGSLPPVRAKGESVRWGAGSNWRRVRPESEPRCAATARSGSAAPPAPCPVAARVPAQPVTSCQKKEKEKEEEEEEDSWSISRKHRLTARWIDPPGRSTASEARGRDALARWLPAGERRHHLPAGPSGWLRGSRQARRARPGPAAPSRLQL